MKAITKQRTGFKFGKYRTQVLKEFCSVEHKGRKYKLVLVETRGEAEDVRHEYRALRLYNQTGRFIKQLMVEPELSTSISELFATATEQASSAK